LTELSEDTEYVGLVPLSASALTLTWQWAEHVAVITAVAVVAVIGVGRTSVVAIPSGWTISACASVSPSARRWVVSASERIRRRSIWLKAISLVFVQRSWNVAIHRT
jgi:hypothetical protein